MTLPPFRKLGRITAPAISQQMLVAPTVTGDTRVATKYGDFWFNRSYAPLHTYTEGAANQYAEELDLPPFPYVRAAMMKMYHPGLGWHVDAARTAVINIGIQNSNTYTIEYENGDTFVMEDGDVYCMDVTRRHRVVPLVDIKEPRFILSICLPNDYDTSSTQTIIQQIYDYLH